MSNCPRCLALMANEPMYCATCGRARIVESLRAPRPSPDGLQEVLRGGVVVLALWFLATAGVAFLREYKAVRDARTFLAAGDSQRAWEVLAPFLENHPRHEQALLIGGKTAFLNNNVAAARKCLDTLTEESPALGSQLAGDYRQALAIEAANQECVQTPDIGNLFAKAKELGPAFPATVAASLGPVVATCASSNRFDILLSITALAVQYGQGIELARHAYLPTLDQLLADVRYADARRLVHGVARGDHGVLVEIQPRLDAERAKIESSRFKLDDLCEKLLAAPQYHTGGVPCFPASAPAEVAAARDGWGRPVAYSGYPEPAAGQSCRPFAVLTSGNGVVGCRVLRGVLQWQLPDAFWSKPVPAGN